MAYDKKINGSLEIIGKLNPNDSGYGFNIPDNSSLVEDKTIATTDQVDLKADKVGPLPHFNISSTNTNVLDFITANNVAGRTIVLHIEGNQDDIIGIVVPVGSKYIFRFTWVSSNIIFESNAPVDLTNITWNDIFNISYSPFKKEFEMTNNKVTSLSSSSTDSEYPSAKAVWDKISLGVNKKHLLYNFIGNNDISSVTFNEISIGDIIIDEDYVFAGFVTSIEEESGHISSFESFGITDENVTCIAHYDSGSWSITPHYVGTKLYKHSLRMSRNSISGTPVDAIIISNDSSNWSGEGLTSKDIISITDGDGYSLYYSADEQLLELDISGISYFSDSAIIEDVVTPF